MARLILDTSVLVAVDRKSLDIGSVVNDDDDVAVAAVTVAELLVGVELAERRRKETRRSAVKALLEALSIESYDLDVARIHAALLAHTHNTGRVRGNHDLIIASTARARERTVLTRDIRGFENLPGVDVRNVPR